MSRAAFRESTHNRCIGIDDGPFVPRRLGGSTAPLMAVMLDGPRLIDARVGWINVDGMDATDQALRLLAGLWVPDCPILLAGVTFGGFNIVDPRKLRSKFKAPTIAVVGCMPDNRAVKRALVRHFPDWRTRWQIIRSLGPFRRVRTVRSENPLYYEAFGCASSSARKILASWALVSRNPEPLRVAGLVAKGLFSSQPVN